MSEASQSNKATPPSSFYALTLGGVLMIAFFPLSLYLMRRSEKVCQFFSVLCLAQLPAFRF